MRVYAWVPSSCFSDPEKTVREMKAAGISVANIMVNPMPEDYGSTPFVTHSIDKINAMAKAWRDAGGEVHLTSWAKPHREYMEGALEVLPGLMLSTGATTLWWDAEEGWTQATGDFDYAEAAALAACIWPVLALSGIGAAPDEIVELAKVCGIHSFQGYATEGGTQATPGGVVPYSFSQWRERYGEPTDCYVVGLAAYDQGSPAASTMQLAIDDVRSDGDHNVCYWTINSIADRDDVTAFVAGLTSAPPVEPVVDVGIFPRLVISSMTKGTVVQLLRIVQGLLLAHGFGPDGLVGPDGRPDGLPGPKTAAALEGFQEMRVLPVTGIVDDATWCSLLRS